MFKIKNDIYQSAIEYMKMDLEKNESASTYQYSGNLSVASEDTPPLFNYYGNNDTNEDIQKHEVSLRVSQIASPERHLMIMEGEDSDPTRDSY